MQAGGRLSINGVPPLPANELSHLRARSWQDLRQLAPSLARRYDGSDGPPPKRQCGLDSIGSHGMPSKAVEGTGGCFLVTTNWLERSLITGAPADVNLFEIQQGVTAMRPAERVQRVQHVPAAEIKAAFLLILLQRGVFRCCCTPTR